MVSIKNMYRMHLMKKALRQIGASVQKSGLRPVQYYVTKGDDQFSLLGYSADGYPIVSSVNRAQMDRGVEYVCDKLENAWRIIDGDVGGI